MRIFLAASTVFLVAGSPYGPPPTDNEVYPSKTNVGCTSIDGCGGQGSFQLPSSQLVKGGIKPPTPGRPYWWEGANNPFKGGSGSFASGSVTTGSFTSSGSTGAGKVSTPFGNLNKNIQDLGSQKCVCPTSSACVHWQLCNNGIMIVDGSVTIDQSNLVIPNQVSAAHGSCGRNMICCQIPTCENSAQGSSLQSQNKLSPSVSNQNDQTSHFTNVKTQFTDQFQPTHDVNSFSQTKVKTPTTFGSHQIKEDSPVSNILPTKLPATNDLNNSFDSETKQQSTSHVSQKFPGIQEIVQPFGVSSQISSESHDGSSVSFNPEPEAETGEIHREYLVPHPSFPKPKPEQSSTSFGSDQSTFTSGQAVVTQVIKTGTGSQKPVIAQKDSPSYSGQVEIKFPSNQHQPGVTSQSGHHSQGSFELGPTKQTFSSGQSDITKKTDLHQTLGQQSQTETKLESDHSSVSTDSEISIPGTQENQFNYGQSQVSTDTDFAQHSKKEDKIQFGLPQFSTGDGFPKADQQGSNVEFGNSQINHVGVFPKPAQQGTQYESGHSQISTDGGFHTPDHQGTKFESDRSKVSSDTQHNLHGTKFESSHSKVSTGTGLSKPGQQGTKFEFSTGDGLSKPDKQGTKFESGHFQINSEGGFLKPNQHETKVESGHSQITTVSGFSNPDQQGTKFESHQPQISTDGEYSKTNQQGTKFQSDISKINTNSGFPTPGQQGTKFESGHTQISSGFPTQDQQGTKFESGQTQISSGFPTPGQQGTKFESGHTQISSGFPTPGQQGTKFESGHTQIGSGFSKPGQQGTTFVSGNQEISAEAGFHKPSQHGTEFETGHSQISTGAGFPEPGQQGIKYESGHSSFNNGAEFPKPSQQGIKFPGHSQVSDVSRFPQPGQYDSLNTETQSQDSVLNLKGVVPGTINRGTGTTTQSPGAGTTTMMMMMGPMLVGGKMMLNGEVMVTASGNQLISGSCSAGTFCLPKSDCNPYNGFIILYANQQLAASFSNAPTVPLLGCQNGSEGATGESFCCQLPHPLLGPDGKPFD